MGVKLYGDRMVTDHSLAGDITVALLMLVGMWLMVILLWRRIEYYYYCKHPSTLLPKFNNKFNAYCFHARPISSVC